MADRACPQCGAPIDPGATECRFCGEKLAPPVRETPPPAAQMNTAPPPPVYGAQAGGYTAPGAGAYGAPPYQAPPYGAPGAGAYGGQPYGAPGAGAYGAPPQGYAQQTGAYSTAGPGPQGGQSAQNISGSGADPSWPVKSKVVAAILALFFGGLGIHKFYLGQIGMGIVYLLFCWTFIPALVAFVEGIIYLTTSDESFERKYHVRVG